MTDNDIRDGIGNYNWKDSLDKWNAGIYIRFAELENLSNRMETGLEQKYWIDEEIKHRKENWQLF